MSENKEKTAGELLREKLTMKSKNGFAALTDDNLAVIDAYCEGYKSYLDAAKTEREAVTAAIALAEKKGFIPYVKGMALKAGDKVYLNNRGKALLLASIGTRPITDGVTIAAAHIDSPRLDMKPVPLYESNELAYFDTRYYGGIKKYQWTAIPLALHGVFVRKDGTVVEVNIGEDENDPVFCITDLLPHLGREQMSRNASEVVRGESLDILIGSRPFKDDEGSDAVKLNILNILNEKYGIIESDFLSAELEAVPAFKAKDIGFDRSLIGAYGHDDRVCAYPAVTAILDADTPAYTAVAILADKEETGSAGNTGMQSSFLNYFIDDIAAAFGEKGHHVLSNSICLSADVNAALDPLYPEVMVASNAAKINHGVCITKYTGGGGKGGTNDASAEYVGYIHNLLIREGILFQTGELGRVDAGGGGTVAKFISMKNIDTIDIGVPVLSMHAPYEVVSKYDIYETYRCVKAFNEDI